MTWRDNVILEAKTWIGTPYHSNARIKNVGVDCGMLLLEVYERCNIIPYTDPGHYSFDWHLHRSEEKYLSWIGKYCDITDDNPLHGDIAVFQFGRCVSHGGIFIGDNKIIHSYIDMGVIVSDLNESLLLDAKGVSRLRGIYRPKVGD